MAKTKTPLDSREYLKILVEDNGNFSRKDALAFHEKFPGLSIEKIEAYLEKNYPDARKFQDFRDEHSKKGKPLSFRDGLKKIFDEAGVTDYKVKEGDKPEKPSGNQGPYAPGTSPQTGTDTFDEKPKGLYPGTGPGTDPPPGNPPGNPPPPEEVDGTLEEEDDNKTLAPWKQKLTDLLGKTESLGSGGLEKFLKEYPDVTAQQFEEYLTKNHPNASILEGFAKQNEYDNLSDIFNGFKDNLNPPKFPDPNEVENNFNDFDKDKYDSVRSDLEEKANFFEALYSGEGGKNTGGNYKYDISGPQAKAYLEQLAIDATQRMQINPTEYGRVEGSTPIMETIKLADGTKVERFSGRFKSNLDKIDEMSLAERYDAGNKTDGYRHNTRKKMFKELSANYDEFAEKSAKNVKDKTAPATKYLTGFGINKDGDTEFSYSNFKDNLKAYRATQEPDRTKVKQAAKALGVKKINEPTNEAIERLTGSLAGIRDSMDLDNISDFKTSLSDFNMSKDDRKNKFMNKTSRTQFL